MNYLSVCSGIEAATVAWKPLGWQAQAFSEIDRFPSAVLAHHYPNTPNLGDMTTYKEWHIENTDLLVGGTPCQSFSVAGLRKGLDDPRGNLALVYLGIAERFRPRWILWENVPGVLSSYTGPKPPSGLEEGQEWEAEETSDFECFTTALVQLGYGFAYRVLDAQYFGVPQRRRRVFVVGYLGDWRRAAAVLFERHSLQGNSPPSRETRQETPSFTPGSLGDYDQKLGGFRASGGDLGGGSENLVCMSHGQSSAEIVNNGSPSLTCNHEAPIVCQGTQDPCVSDIAHPIGRNNGGENCVAYSIRTAQTGSNGQGVSEDLSYTLDGANGQAVAKGLQVRRLTPVECERLQGFPDNYTQIPWRNKEAKDCPLGHRYKALGNSMAVPCMRWLGERISMVDKI
jgi:DNA (cytosine-5)-methyltransferase 1